MSGDITISAIYDDIPTSRGRELTDREKAAFIVRDEWTSWVSEFTDTLKELDQKAVSRIYDNMDFYDMQYRFTEKYKKVPEYLAEDGKPTQKLKDLIKAKRKELRGVRQYDYLKFTAKENNSTIYYTYGGPSSSIKIGYSDDGTSFVEWNEGNANKITLNQDESIYVRNYTGTLSDGTNKFKFIMSGSFDSSGQVDSLINFKELTPYCFAELFDGRTQLKTAPVLSATTLAPHCYENMFRGTSITASCELPASVVPESAYNGMFFNCIYMTYARSMGAKSVANNGCNSMFANCYQLVTAPEISATVAGERAFYGMFAYCSNLEKAPTTLYPLSLSNSVYENMFVACTRLENAPEIMATTITGTDALKLMFSSCQSLKYIRIHYAGTIDTTNFTNWVSDVANTGVLYYDGEYTGDPSEYGPSGLPKNATYKWTIHRNGE